jgi:hypothetical protein
MIHVLRPSAAIAACVLLSLWTGPSASGSEVQASDPPPSAFSLTVSPTRLVISPSDVGHTQRVKVRNGGASPVAVTVQKRSFSARPDGTLAFQAEAPYSAAEWLSLDATSFELPPGASRVVSATVTVPASPEPGDHQMALVFLVPSGQTKDNVKINRGIAIPAFVTVAGAVNESAALTELSASSTLSFGGPVTITAKVRSTGTVHRDFRGADPLQVSGAGRAKAFPDFTVMRGATRTIVTRWNPPLMCICHPSVSIVGADGIAHSMSIRVVVIPVLLIGEVAGGVLVLLIGFRLARRGYRANVLKAASVLHRPVSSGDA